MCNFFRNASAALFRIVTVWPVLAPHLWNLLYQLEIYVWCDAFTATNINKVFSGYQRCQLIKSHQHFRDHFCPHHQDNDITMCPDSPTHIAPKRLCLTLSARQWEASGWTVTNTVKCIEIHQSRSKAKLSKHLTMWDFRFSWRQVWSLESSGMYCHVVKCSQRCVLPPSSSGTSLHPLSPQWHMLRIKQGSLGSYVCVGWSEHIVTSLPWWQKQRWTMERFLINWHGW
jgi:hypothetical protein